MTKRPLIPRKLLLFIVANISIILTIALAAYVVDRLAT